ncbi:MAG TPA: N-6 DNA methylase [Paludibacteraceae bacterium]|nr:N-6 DNA methylase [Paludibacteraceae bacterium]HPD58528.1 N-6 DNA methylase [Paludibacteraceae bacterium]HPL75865.1 N-6 DNA methylase [Paludibacteraceae bacterium]HRS24812.1 N-6 DNA methylase [Paludibacteraceae bacterium]HRT77754.1 N-6 DNA methylase [Paludibacteraceae bacterium]
MLKQYLNSLQATFNQGDAREESYYGHLKDLLLNYTDERQTNKVDITVLPKPTEAGNPDFRIWDGKNHITGYIEAKDPSVTNLDRIEVSGQLKRYRETFPNVILTNFYEFRLYRNGELIKQVLVGRPELARKLKTAPPVENETVFFDLLDTFFSFSLPHVRNAQSLATELAKRTRFLRDEVVSIELDEEEKRGKKAILGFYEAFRKYLIGTLTKEAFADLYSQTLTYGLFAARTRSDNSFNRELAFKYIPNTIGILRDVFRFISLEDPPKPLQVIVDDIAEVLSVTDVRKILEDYFEEGKGQDPIVHFYETFLTAYDPSIREKRGVYYTPEPVVRYIVRSVNELLKTHFDMPDGLASKNVTLLDPAAGTLTFPAEAVKLAVKEFTEKYGSGGRNNFIRNQVLENFFAFELMMAPYAIGHLKMSFLLEELGYKLNDEERFKLYLTNTLEMDELEQISIPGLSSLSEESHLAGKIKKEQPVLVILGNPPYSGISANVNEWTEKLLKQNIDGAQSYYEVDGKTLGEKNPKWLQDDYVKFLRFAQWKIQKAGFGVVGMITNHSYLDNPTFRGMRQSLMKTFNEIYILDLHGNSLKKETAPDGGKDENVFDIRQGTAIAIFVKQKEKSDCKVYHAELFGKRQSKYDWLDAHQLEIKNYQLLKPESPWYFFIPRNTQNIKYYLKWKQINEIFPVNGVGITTARDNFVIDFRKEALLNKIRLFKNSKFSDNELYQFFHINKKIGWNIRKAWNMLQDIPDNELENFIFDFIYRPFDHRYIFWHDSLVWRTVKQIMSHILKENLSITTVRQVKSGETWQHSLVSDKLIESCYISNKTSEICYAFPLYLYNEHTPKKSRTQYMMMLFEPETEYGNSNKEPNIDKKIYQTLNQNYGHELTPEEILYYIYAVFYSNIYREKYAEFLKIDFPRVPFTTDYKVFSKMAALGNELVDLHLMKSSRLNTLVSKFQGEGENDVIEEIIFRPEESRIYINSEKYFDNVAPQVWDYQVGGYRVLQKYLKDRKGRKMDDFVHYSQIITALNYTIEIQQEIDTFYSEAEKEVIEF